MNSAGMKIAALVVVLSALASTWADDYVEGYTKLVVGTGLTDDTGFYKGTPTFEVVDLTGHLTGGETPSLTCAPLADYPHEASNAFGAYWDDAIVVCGGVERFHQLEGCYTYQGGAWEKVTNLTMLDAPRFNAATWASPGNNWFVHDGISGSDLSERELTLDQDQDTFREYRIETGLNLDSPMAGHAMIRTFIDVEGFLEDDIVTYYIAGGQDAEGSEYYNATYSLSYLIKGQYDQQSDMLEARSTAFYGMAVLPKPVEDGEPLLNDTESALVVAGGYNLESGYLTTSEVYSPDADTWTSAGELPGGVGVRGGASVQLNETFLAVGGLTADGDFSNKIYAWDNTAVGWTEAAGGVALPTGRAYMVAFLVPDSEVECS